MHFSIAQPIRVAGILALLASGLSAHAAFDAFLKIEGVPGESTDSTRSGWIQVDSLHFGMTGVSDLAPTQLAPLTLRKRVDQASPLLASACATGKQIAQVKLELVRTTPKRARFYQVTLEDVLVSSVSSSGAADGDTLSELVQLLAGRWSWSYTEFALDEMPVQDLDFDWNVVRNTGESSVTPAMRASGTQSIDGQFTIVFPAKAGVAYRILGGADLTGAFSEVRRLEPTEGGETAVTLPADGSTRFFRVEELP
ncbi:MAG: type VI secretion system tube protein Hcp [Verrucomicrobia bacterium]|nr:type VI secretion system tube protein Hcp [Verrucomicrobiota bacterium]